MLKKLKNNTYVDMMRQKRGDKNKDKIESLKVKDVLRLIRNTHIAQTKVEQSRFVLTPEQLQSVSDSVLAAISKRDRPQKERETARREPTDDEIKSVSEYISLGVP